MNTLKLYAGTTLDRHGHALVSHRAILGLESLRNDLLRTARGLTEYRGTGHYVTDSGALMTEPCIILECYTRADPAHLIAPILERANEHLNQESYLAVINGEPIELKMREARP